MIIWQGWGLLVAVITFASSLVFEIGTESYFADDTYYQTHAWPLTTALLAAAVANWAAAQLLERRGGRVLIDPQTGETVVIGGRRNVGLLRVLNQPGLEARFGGAPNGNVSSCFAALLNTLPTRTNSVIRKILEALGLRSAPRTNGANQIRQIAARALEGQPPITPAPRAKPRPRHQPYRETACNEIYNLLFCDDGRMPIGAMDDSVASLRAVADDESQEGRNRMWAYTLLREKGEPVPPGILLGVIVEVAMDKGLDVLAAFSDGSVRYINYTEKMGFVEGQVPQLEEHIEVLIDVSRFIVNQIGPSTEARLPPPPKGEVRTTFLVSDGLYFGQGPYDVLRNDEMGRLVLVAAESLLGAFVALDGEFRPSA